MTWTRDGLGNGSAHRQDTAGAEKLLKEATALELTLDAPSGPADPIKPSFELYGELLVDLGRMQEAAAQFQQSLERMPNRRASVQGLQKTAPARSSQAPQR